MSFASRAKSEDMIVERTTVGYRERCYARRPDWDPQEQALASLHHFKESLAQVLGDNMHH